MSDSIVAQSTSDFELLGDSRDAWLTAHAEQVAAVQPAWANPELTMLGTAGCGPDLFVDAIEFRRRFGRVVVDQVCYIDGDTFQLHGEPSFQVAHIADRLEPDRFEQDDAAAVGADLIVATQHVSGHVENISLTVLVAVARAVGTTASDILALGEQA